MANPPDSRSQWARPQVDLPNLISEHVSVVKYSLHAPRVGADAVQMHIVQRDWTGPQRTAAGIRSFVRAPADRGAVSRLLSSRLNEIGCA